MVILGDDLRLVRITKVVGVGCNFIKFGVETLGSSSKDEVPVQRIIISFFSDDFHLTCIQCLKHYFFHRFLKLMREVVDVERVWDESEMMAQEVECRLWKIVVQDVWIYNLGVIWTSTSSATFYVPFFSIPSAFILLLLCPDIFHRKS